MKITKYILNHTWKPWLQWYHRKPRPYEYMGIEMIIHPQVFHPGYFYSTQYLVDLLLPEKLNGKTFLEPGCGSGFISIFAAKKGAKVTALDINPHAVAFLKQNALKNNVRINVLESDMFEKLPRQVFDYIIINPPYFEGNPESWEEFAWYFGDNYDYYKKLFASLNAYMDRDSKVWMVLSEECPIEIIMLIAKHKGFKMEELSSRKFAIEKNFIFKISFE